MIVWYSFLESLNILELMLIGAATVANNLMAVTLIVSYSDSKLKITNSYMTHNSHNMSLQSTAMVRPYNNSVVHAVADLLIARRF